MKDQKNERDHTSAHCRSIWVKKNSSSGRDVLREGDGLFILWRWFRNYETLDAQKLTHGSITDQVFSLGPKKGRMGYR